MSLTMVDISKKIVCFMFERKIPFVKIVAFQSDDEIKIEVTDENGKEIDMFWFDEEGARE